jgi:hypothetical protein
MEAKQLRDMQLDDVISWMGRSDPSSPNHDRGMAELRFREITLQMKSSEAQIAAANAEKRAADAAVESADATKLNAKYMLWSVVAAAFSAFGSLATAIITAVHK